MATPEYTSGNPIEFPGPHVNNFRNAAYQI